MFATALRRILLLAALAGILQVGLLACSSGSSGGADETSIDPEAADHLVKARQQLEEGTLRPALSHTDSALAIDSTAADVHFLRGRIFTQLSRYEEAENAYKTALSINPEHQGAWFNIGNNYFRRRRFREALNYYHREEENYPSPSLYVHMAQSYGNLDRADSAIYAYKQALAQDSSYAPAHVWLGQLYKDQGDYQRALEHTRRALTLDSTNLQYRFFVGTLLLRTDRPKEAIAHLEQVARAQPYHYAAHYNLGRAYARLGQEEQAQEYLAVADTLQQAQSKIARLETMARENPDQPKHWLDLAQALQDVGRLQHARKAYNIALSMVPGNVGIRNNLANIALALGDTTGAISRYKDILRRDSAQADIWLNLGVVYAQTGKRQEAIEAWRQALRIDPDHPRAKSYLSQITG
jgi:tetratricopeptide (TPR) repeat protein